MLYHGLEVMGGGSILAGLVLGAIGVFVIERDFVKASAFAFSGAVLTYFGFMHGEAVGIGGGLGVTPAVALAYAVVAAGFFAVSRLGTSTHLRLASGDAACRACRMKRGNEHPASAYPTPDRRKADVMPPRPAIWMSLLPGPCVPSA